MTGCARIITFSYSVHILFYINIETWVFLLLQVIITTN